MSRRGPAGGPKRKRNWDIECPSFLEERPQQLRKASLQTVGLSWLKCGEGFQDTSGTLSSVAEKATITKKKLELSPAPEKETISKSSNEIANITWSSSESESSDEDKAVFKSQRDNGHSSRIHRFCSRNTLCPEDEATEDEVQSIDWEVDSDREDADDCSESEDGEGAMAISDCASCASAHSLTSEDGLPELSKVSPPEISRISQDSTI